MSDDSNAVPPGVLVETTQGKVPVEDITPGDLVKSTTGDVVVQQVWTPADEEQSRWRVFSPVINVKVKKLRPDVMLPTYATEGSSGMDVRACIDHPVRICSGGHREAIPTGLAFEIPPGYEIQVRPRSGLALKSGITVANSPGTLDSSYRGELAIILVNHDLRSAFVVQHQDRIAQIVLQKVPQMALTEVETLSDTARGEGGFGSTGIK